MRRWPATIAMAFSVMLVLGAGLAEQEGTLAASSTPQNTQGTQLLGFVITLVLGGNSSEGPAPSGALSLTSAETRALADLKGFLPYKFYLPLDTVRVIGLNGPHLFLRGVGQKHEFYMQSTQVDPTHVSVDMLRLWDVQPVNEKKAPAALIDTTFKMDVGETVVVGTSRLDDGRALILLVTAAKR